MSAYARFTSSAAGLLVLAACVSSSPRAGHPMGSQSPTAQEGAAPTDTSYDWHDLMLAPFGTLLKESPIALHEVLLFHDESRGPTEVDGSECYGVGAPPRFVGRRPDGYLLCFDHDRLNRIDVSVRLAADEAAQVFAHACAFWLKNSVPIPAAGNTCEGRDGGIAFSAHLGQVPDEPAALLTMTLSNAAERDAIRDAAHDTAGAAQHEK